MVHASDPAFTISEQGPVLWVTCAHDGTISNSDAAALIEATSRIARPLVLIELNQLTSLSREVQQRLAAELDVAALALVGPTAVDRMLAAFFMGVHRPPFPTRYFTVTEEARVWLVARHRNDRGRPQN